MSVRLHIERLVLDGVPLGRSERPRLGVALEAELGRLIAEGGLSESLVATGAWAARRADPVPLPATADSPGFGVGLARAVYGAIGR